MEQENKEDLEKFLVAFTLIAVLYAFGCFVEWLESVTL